jgi:hypothetical protein
MAIYEPYFTISYLRQSIRKLDLILSAALHLGPCQNDTRLERLSELILMAGFSIVTYNVTFAEQLRMNLPVEVWATLLSK